LGRTGISQVAVMQARNEIISSGHEPSVRKIQALIGGSSTTVAAFLKRIMDEEGGLFGSGKLVDKELTQLVVSLHDRLKAITDQKLAVGEVEAQRRVEEAVSEVANAHLQHAETQRLLAVANAELETSKATNARLVELLNAANRQIAVDAKALTLLQSANELQANEVQRLQREGDLRQIAYEAFQTATQRSREATQTINSRERQTLIDSHAESLADMRKERDKLTHERSELTAANAQLARDNERLAHEVIAFGKNLRSAQDIQRDLQAEVNQAAREVSEARIAAAEVGGQAALLRSQLSEINAWREVAVAELQNARATVENLSAELARQQAEKEISPK